MTSQQRSRNEYIARINRVMDYVERNLDEPLGLETLAKVALLSPFHFHRIFTLMVGETPGSFIARVRLERTAQQIKDHPNRSISEIALDNGFSSLSLFSRCFRKQFGMTAKEYRNLEKPVFTNKGLQYSKNGQLLSNISQPVSDFETQLCSVKLNQLIVMNTTVEVKEMPEMNVIYCRHTGAFDQIHVAYDKLMRFAGPRGLLNRPEAKTLTVYHDDPSVTAIENVRQSACLVVQEEVKVEGEIGKMTVPAGKYAVLPIEIDVTEFEKAWNTICLWFTQSGYEPGEGYPYELYYADPSTHPENKFVLDICIPVRTL
jgi:AraC family transcriptional regulator